jgi:perosamine synthetase
MINVFEPKISFKDKLSVLNALNKNLISGTSPLISEFETKLAEKFNRKFSVLVSNGTVALEVAFKLLNLKKDDEVILPSFTIVSCLAAVIRSNATPIFCDVNPISWNMTLQNVKNVTTKKTKVILMVHTYGLTSEAEEIEEFCKSNNIILIEDGAEAHGQIYNNKKCGSFGEISTLSFYANKHLTTGEGGAILTNNEVFYREIKQMINLDFKEPNRFNHDHLYWNYRLSSLQAALGLSQINKLEKVIKMKIKQGTYYNKLFKDYSEYFQTPSITYNGVQNNFWVYGLVLNKKFSREKLKKYLFFKNIEVRDFFWPLHLQNAYKNTNQNNDLEISENLGKQGLYIPIGPHINKNIQNRIYNEIISGLNKQI